MIEHPRRTRLGLIEANNLDHFWDERLHRIRGVRASASLKLVDYSALVGTTGPHPRRTRLGLIEAR